MYMWNSASIMFTFNSIINVSLWYLMTTSVIFYLFSFCVVLNTVCYQCVVISICFITSRKCAGKWFLGKHYRNREKNYLIAWLYINCWNLYLFTFLGCIFWCRVRSEMLEKDLLQPFIRHIYGFSLVCRLSTCSLR